MVYLEQNFVELLESKQKELEDVNIKLSFEEVLMDKKLTIMLQTKQKFLSNIIEKYKLVNNLIDEIEKLTDEEKQLFSAEITKTEIQINKLKNEIYSLIYDQNGENESVTLQIITKDYNKQFNELISAYKNFCNHFNLKFTCENESLYRIYGVNAKKYFLGENGVHKLKSTKLQVIAYSSIEKITPTFDEKDIKIDIFRSNGAGGQNVNKVSTAIRATHILSNITVMCQDERSQLQNKNRALEILKERVTNYYNSTYEKQVEEAKKHNISNKIVRIYDYENEIVTQNNKTISLKDFINGNYMQLLN